MKHGIYIAGLGPSPESTKELRKAVMAVLASGQDQKTIRKALDVLQKGVSGNNTLSDVHVNGGMS